MNLDDLRALLSVVEHGSFQAAAASHDVPRTKLRRQVDRLEKVVGSRLVHREARGVRLTLAGEQIAERAGPLLVEASTMLDAARAVGGGDLGTLRLIVPVGTPTAPRVRALLSLQALHPGIALDVVEVDDPLTLLRSPFDIMLHLGDSPAREGWFSRVLMRLPLRLVASPEYLEEHGTPTTLEDLRRHRLLSWRAGGRFGDTWPLLNGGTVPIAASVVSANPELLAKTAEQGGGIALLPGPAELFQPSGDELVRVLEDQVGGEIPLRVLTPHPSRTDPRLRVLIENAKALLATLSNE